MNEQRLEQLEKNVELIKNSQQTIVDALLGRVNEDKIGLIEETRGLKKDVHKLQITQEIHAAQIAETVEFRKNARKIVVGFSLAIPFIIEIFKITFSSFWDTLIKKH